jgi:hypothetical protein
MRRFKKLFVTILVVATVLGTASAFTGAAGLLDVEGTKYADAVNKLVGINVITGFPDGTFKPTATVTRGQMAAIMVRGLGHEALAALSKGSTSFSDVPATHWASGYINVAFNKNIINGMGDGTFKPDATVTYAQAVTMLVRAVNRAGEVVGAWPVGYIEVAQRHGLTANVSFVSAAPATRGDIAIMTNTAVFTVTDPVTKETLAWSAHKVAAAKPDQTAPVVTLAAVAAKTLADKITVTGTVDEAATVTVNGTAATVVGLTFSAEVALTAGANTITVEATDKYSNKGTATAAITRQTIASVKVTPATATAAQGTSVQFTAKAFDAADVELEGVTFNWTVTGPGMVNASGLYAAVGSGAATVKATAKDAIDKEGTAAVSVFGAATKVVFSTPAAVVANTKSKVALVATAQDANGNTVTTFTGNVTFATSAAAFGALSKTVAAAVNGVATVDFTATGNEGTTILSVGAAGLTGQTLNYTTTKQALTNITAAVDPAKIAAAGAVSTATITLTAKDQVGENMQAAKMPAALNVRLTTSDKTVAKFSGGGASADGATADVAMGGVAAVPRLIEATTSFGSVSVTGAVTTVDFTTVTVGSVNVESTLIGLPHKLAIDAIASVKALAAPVLTFRVLDFNGNQVNTFTAAGVVNVARGTTALGAQAVANGKGVFADAALPGIANNAGTYTYKVTGAGGLTGIASATATCVVTPDAAHHIDFAAAPTTLAANGSQTSTLTAKIHDAQSNVVTDGAYVIELSKTAGTGTAAFTTTNVTTANGVATATVTATTNISAGDQFQAKPIGWTAGTVALGGPGIVTVIMGNASQLAFVGVPANAVAGTDLVVPVHVQDANLVPTTLTYDNGRAVTLTVKNGATVLGTHSASTVNGVATFKVNLTTTYAGLTLVADSAGLPSKAFAGPNPAIIAAAPASFVLSANPTTLAADNVSATTIVGTLKDAFGNTTANPVGAPNIVINLSIPAAMTYGAFGGAAVTTITIPATATNANSALDFTAKTGIGVTTVTGADAASVLTGGTLDVSTILVGAANRLVVTVDKTSETTGVVINGKVTVVDAAGNRLTASVIPITVAATGAGTVVAPAIATVAVKGVLAFTVGNITALASNVSATAAGLTSNTVGVTFVPGAAAHIHVGAPAVPANIKGDGASLTTVTATVHDANNNAVTGYTGTVTFSVVTGNDYASLIQTTATPVNGVASIQAQSKVVTSWSAVVIKATSDLNADGDSIDAGETDQQATFAVMSLPKVASVTKSAGPAPFIWTITFSNPMDWAASLITIVNVDTKIPPTAAVGGAAQTWGGAGLAVATPDAFTLTITEGAAPTAVTGSLINPAATVVDLAGNADATAPAFVLP